MSLRRILFPLVLAVMLMAACHGSRSTSATRVPSSGSGPATGGGPNPAVPYSPPTTPFVERTTGFIPDTLTLPTSDGGKLYITPVTTAMTTTYVNWHRSLSVWVTITNPGTTGWTGVPARHAELLDQTGATFPAVFDVTAADLYPVPQRYGGSNRDLSRSVTIGGGRSMEGVLVFRPTGGNRAITLRISVDGTNWAEWQTNLGVF